MNCSYCGMGFFYRGGAEKACGNCFALLSESDETQMELKAFTVEIDPIDPFASDPIIVDEIDDDPDNGNVWAEAIAFRIGSQIGLIQLTVLSNLN